MTQFDAAHAELSARNKKTVEDFYSGVATGTPENPARLFHPDVTVYEPYVLPWGGTYVGMEGQKQLSEQQHGRLDPSTLKVLALHADGDTVVSELSIVSAGANVDIRLSEFMVLRDDKIVEQRVYVFGAADRPLTDVL